MDRVKGKVAIITGAAGGLGRSFAQRLASEGAAVMMTDTREEGGEAAAISLGSGVRFMRHDVTREDDWMRVIRATEEAFGPVSILVNNAGVNNHCLLENLEEAEYRRVIDINQVGVFLGMKSVVPSMKRAGGGSIVNISSVCGIFGVAKTIAYTAAKFAVRGMTKSAAMELAALNIRVNSVHPGLIDTPMNTPTPENRMNLEASAAATPLGRMGQPDEVASLVLLLASDESRFSTGAEFVADGGLTAGRRAS